MQRNLKLEMQKVLMKIMMKNNEMPTIQINYP